jgi:hypothetical protein
MSYKTGEPNFMFPELFERLQRFVRRNGVLGVPITVFRKVWRWLFLNRHFVFSRSLAISSAAPALVPGLRIERFASAIEVPVRLMEQLLAEEGPHRAAWIRSEFETHGILWLGVLDDNVVAYQWCRRGAFICHWFVPLNDDDLVIFATVTFPRWRGRRISPAMMSQIIAYELRGQAKAYVDCKIWNKAAMRGIEKAGFELLCESPQLPATN